jgi:hypothetical protein
LRILAGQEQEVSVQPTAWMPGFLVAHETGAVPRAKKSVFPLSLPVFIISFTG